MRFGNEENKCLIQVEPGLLFWICNNIMDLINKIIVNNITNSCINKTLLILTKKLMFLTFSAYFYNWIFYFVPHIRYSCLSGNRKIISLPQEILSLLHMKAQKFLESWENIRKYWLTLRWESLIFFIFIEEFHKS